MAILRKSIEVGGRTLTLETGRMAKQASGAIFGAYGEIQARGTRFAGVEHTHAPPREPVERAVRRKPLYAKRIAEERLHASPSRSSTRRTFPSTSASPSP